MGYLGKTVQIDVEKDLPDFMTREELIAKAYAYSKKNPEISLTKVSKLNGLRLHEFRSFLTKFALAWRHDSMRERTQKMIQYCKKHQDKTLSECAINLNYARGKLQRLCHHYGYNHPKALKILRERNYPKIIKLVKEGKTIDYIKHEIHTDHGTISKLRSEYNIPNCSTRKTGKQYGLSR